MDKNCKDIITFLL